MTVRDDKKPTSAGRVVHDERGNAVWQPAAQVDSEELHDLLQTDQLALAETGQHRALGVPQEGFDPYGHTTVVHKTRDTGTRTDLRKLSAQIVAEREREKKQG